MDAPPEKERITHNDERERARHESSEIQHLSEAVMQLVEDGNNGEEGEEQHGVSGDFIQDDEEKHPHATFSDSEGSIGIVFDDAASNEDIISTPREDNLPQPNGYDGARILYDQEVEEVDQGGLRSSGSEFQTETGPRREPVPLSAVRVTPEEEEARVLRRILDQAVRADVIVPTGGPREEAIQPSKRTLHRKRLLIVGATVILGLIIGLVGWILHKGGKIRSSLPRETPVHTSTLGAVQERGVLRCGVPDVFFFKDYDDNGERVGFEIDLCKAVAAGILGDKSKFEIIDVPVTDRFTTLASGPIDLYFRAAPTIGRDIQEESSGVGISFSTPYYYGGVGFGGKKSFVKCAEELNTTQDECKDLMICTGPGTTHTELIKGILPSAHVLILFANETMSAFMEGRCNVIFAHVWTLVLVLVKQDTFGTGHTVGKEYTHEPLSIVTRDDDPHWSDMVNWVLQSLFEAEKLGITQNSAGDFKTTSVFGEDYANIFRNAIAASGNYGEIYERHLESALPRRGMMLLNTNHTSGIIWTHGIGPDAANTGPPPISGGELERISRKEYLTCGITDARPGFAEFNSTTGVWRGLDVDFCRAVASSIFFGLYSEEKVRFVEFKTVEDGYGALSDRSVDVLCGQRVTLGADVSGYGSGEGAAFSVPYYYEEDDDNRALAVRQSDGQWSSFMYWVVACTITAEVESIMQATANEMPVMNLFGSRYRRMFRDSIVAVGNYGEMYDRNLENLIPRSGLNLLNVDPVGPQIYPLPFDESVQ